MLSLENVSVSYGPIQAVRKATVSVAAGEIVTLLGPNGAGKSSTLKAIMGLHPVAAGRIVFEGQPISGLATEKIVRKGMTLTPEGRHVFAGLTVDENLRLGAAARRDRGGVSKTRSEIFELFPILRERINQLVRQLRAGAARPGVRGGADSRPDHAGIIGEARSHGDTGRRDSSPAQPFQPPRRWLGSALALLLPSSAPVATSPKCETLFWDSPKARRQTGRERKEDRGHRSG